MDVVISRCNSRIQNLKNATLYLTPNVAEELHSHLLYAFSLV